MNESIPTIEPPLTSDDELAALVRSISDPRVAIDAEGDGLYRYRTRLCTLQIASTRGVAVVDTLAPLDLSLLAPLLGEAGPIKVVHDASFDARVLARRGLVLSRVFDTAVAARFLGETATGLASLLRRYLDVTLDKDHQMADWGVRPIGEDELAYLVADVMHLVALVELLEACFVELDLIEEVEEETRYVLSAALEPEPVREPWTRIKGARELGHDGQALLAALADVREREADERDVPPFRVAPNGALFEAAQRNASDVLALRRIRGLRGLSDTALEEAIDLARVRGAPPEPDPPPPAADRARWRACEKLLSAWRAAEAKARGVNEQAVLPGHCLRDLAHLPEPTREALATVAGLGEKRIERYGNALLDAIRAEPR